MQDIHAVAQPAHTSAHATRSTHRAVTRLVVGELFLPPRATCVVLSLSHDTGPVQTNVQGGSYVAVHCVVCQKPEIKG